MRSLTCKVHKPFCSVSKEDNTSVREEKKGKGKITREHIWFLVEAWNY